MKKVSDCRDLSEEEIVLINEGKELAEQCGRYINKLMALEEVDKRSASIAKTKLQTGFMWLTKSIKKPESF